MTYTLIDSVTLGSSASSVTFSSISQDYRDLVLVVEYSATTATVTVPLVRFNGDSGTNYNRVLMYGNGTSSFSVANAGLNHVSVSYDSGAISSTKTMFVLQVMDYSATDKHKTTLSRSNNTARSVEAMANRWANTNAITSISLTASTPNFASGSTFFLYGIEA